MSPGGRGYRFTNYNSHQLLGPELQLPSAPEPGIFLVTSRGLCWILNLPYPQSQGGGCTFCRGYQAKLGQLLHSSELGRRCPLARHVVGPLGRLGPEVLPRFLLGELL